MQIHADLMRSLVGAWDEIVVLCKMYVNTSGHDALRHEQFMQAGLTPVGVR